MIKKDLGIKVLMKLISGIAYHQEKEKWKKLTSKLPDNFYYFELWKPEKQRTSPQNRYYWKAVVKPFADHCGYLLNEHKEVEEGLFNAIKENLKEIKKKLKNKAHDRLKEQFLFLGFIPKTDIEIIKSTTELSTKGFWEYVENCRIWLRKEYNIDTEDPEPYKIESYRIEKEKNGK